MYGYCRAKHHICYKALSDTPAASIWICRCIRISLASRYARLNGFLINNANKPKQCHPLCVCRNIVQARAYACLVLGQTQLKALPCVALLDVFPNPFQLIHYRCFKTRSEETRGSKLQSVCKRTLL